MRRFDLDEPDAEELRRIATDPHNIRLNKLLLESFERSKATLTRRRHNSRKPTPQQGSTR